MVVERYEEVISKADENIVLDGVRRAFNLVKAQACMLATLFIPAIQEFLLPELKNAWHGVLRMREGLAASHSMLHVDEAVEEMDMTIMFFEDLIKTLWTTARSWTNQGESRMHAKRCAELRLHTAQKAL